MTDAQVEHLVDLITGADIDRAIEQILGTDRTRVRAEWLNRVFGHRAGGVCIVFKL
jgi:hypothetical protein